MSRATTYHEAKAEIRKRGPGAGLETLVEELVKMTSDELRAAAKAAPAPVRDARPVRHRAFAVVEKLAEAERARDPKLTEAQAIAKAIQTPLGQEAQELYVDGLRRGEPGVPIKAPVAKAAPGSCCSFFAEIERIAEATIVKRDHRVSKPQAITEATMAWPDLYAEHLAQHRY